LSASLECGGLAPLCYSIGRDRILKRRLAAALQGLCSITIEKSA